MYWKSLALIAMIFVSYNAKSVEFKPEQNCLDTAVSVFENLKELSIDQLQMHYEGYNIEKSGGLENAKIVLIGETHTDAYMKLVQAALLEKLCSKDDLILLEGKDSDTPIKKSGIILSLVISAAASYQLTGTPYQPSGYDKTAASIARYFPFSGYVSKFGKSEYNRGFWDDRSPVSNIPQIKSQRSEIENIIHFHCNMHKRNQAMASKIKEVKSEFEGKIFVIAGSKHLYPKVYNDYAEIRKKNFDGFGTASLSLSFRMANLHGFDKMIEEVADEEDLETLSLTLGDLGLYSQLPVYNFLTKKSPNDHAILIPKR